MSKNDIKINYTTPPTPILNNDNIFNENIILRKKRKFRKIKFLFEDQIIKKYHFFKDKFEKLNYLKKFEYNKDNEFNLISNNNRFNNSEENILSSKIKNNEDTCNNSVLSMKKSDENMHMNSISHSNISNKLIKSNNKSIKTYSLKSSNFFCKNNIEDGKNGLNNIDISKSNIKNDLLLKNTLFDSVIPYFRDSNYSSISNVGHNFIRKKPTEAYKNQNMSMNNDIIPNNNFNRLNEVIPVISNNILVNNHNIYQNNLPVQNEKFSINTTDFVNNGYIPTINFPIITPLLTYSYNIIPNTQIINPILNNFNHIRNFNTNSSFYNNLNIYSGQYFY